jgi:uncharacterized phage-associated protein
MHQNDDGNFELSSGFDLTGLYKDKLLSYRADRQGRPSSMKPASRTSFPFDGRKATEVAAAFLERAGGTINVMKLVKLLYLLDRESIGRRGVPVVGGVYLSMRNGPVTSEVLDLINAGSLWNCETNWSRFISDRQNHEVALTGAPGKEHLSQFEINLIDELFAQFRKADQWALSDFCHEHCGEWLPLEAGREHISLAKLAEEVGTDPDEVLQNAAQAALLKEVFA